MKLHERPVAAWAIHARDIDPRKSSFLSAKHPNQPSVAGSIAKMEADRKGSASKLSYRKEQRIPQVAGSNSSGNSRPTGLTMVQQPTAVVAGGMKEYNSLIMSRGMQAPNATLPSSQSNTSTAPIYAPPVHSVPPEQQPNTIPFHPIWQPPKTSPPASSSLSTCIYSPAANPMYTVPLTNGRSGLNGQLQEKEQRLLQLEASRQTLFLELKRIQDEEGRIREEIMLLRQGKGVS